MAWGARFDRDPDGQPALAIEGAHSARRVLHAHDATGREIGRVLWERASALPGVVTHSHARVVDLVVEDGRCAGARFLADDGGVATAHAPQVLLATGGAGQVYSETTNPHVATGDGVAMALSGGCGGRGSRVRPVPSDGIERPGAAALSAVGGASRRGCQTPER